MALPRQSAPVYSVEPPPMEWRVLSFHGNIHISTILATDEEDARRIAAESHYDTVIEKRDPGQWERIR